MKTSYLLTIVFFLGISLTTVAQSQRTSFENISVVTTSGGTSVQLSWKKGDEAVAFYIVERSTDGIDFKQCGIVMLSEDPEFVAYKFRDKVIGANSNLHYRIGIVNQQKRITYLPTRQLVAGSSL